MCMPPAGHSHAISLVSELPYTSYTGAPKAKAIAWRTAGRSSSPLVKIRLTRRRAPRYRSSWPASSRAEGRP